MKIKSILIIIILTVSLIHAQSWSSVGEGVYLTKNPNKPSLPLGEDDRRGRIGEVFNGSVNALLVFEGELYVGGYFKFAGDRKADFIAKWNGEKWSPVGTGIDGQVTSLCIYKGELYAGGLFNTAGGIKANNIAKWNGKKWSALPSGTNADIIILTIFQGDLYAAGSFTEAGGKPARHFAKWNGTTWSALGEGKENSIYAMAEYNGELYAGGTFLNAADRNEKSIYKWNGKKWSDVAVHMDGGVSGLFSFNSKLYAGGYFTNANETYKSLLVAYDGKKWEPVGNGIVKKIEGASPSSSGGSGNGSEMHSDVATNFLAHDGILYTGGAFFDVGTQGVAKWDGTEWSALRGGVNGVVNAMVLYKGDLYVGGDFSKADNIGVNYIAKWSISDKAQKK